MSLDSVNRRVVLSSRPKGVPQSHHFAIEDVPLQPLKSGEFRVRTLFWSIDPAMRGWANDAPNYLPPVEIGAPMRAFAVAEVVESQHPDYAAGEIVSGMFGWQRYATSDGSDVDRKVGETDLSPSLALGVLGLNGITAFYGLLDICDPQRDEAVVVSTAAGAVGSVVGQIAKIKGAKTVGITSSAEKVRLCVEKFRFDAAISYKTEDVGQRVREIMPEGVDCYFDNTCGPISDAVMTNLAKGARITICGTASLVDWDPIPQGPRVHRQMIVARARMQGFLVLDHKPRFAAAIEQLAEWVRQGKIEHNEHVLDGIESAPESIKMLYESRNTGKLVVKVD